MLIEALDEAFADLNKAIEVDPRSGLAFAYRAYAYKQNDQIDVALRDIEVAQKLSPNAPEVYWVRAEIEEVQGQTQQAIADLKKAQSLRPGYRDARDALARLGAAPSETLEKEVAGAGVDTWRVVARGKEFFAADDRYPRLSVPLEMMGEGEPKLLEWQMKGEPYSGIGTLRFSAGKIAGRSGPEPTEFVAILDIEAGKVIAIEPHKQGEKVAKWTWETGKVTVASVDGVTDELDLRVARKQVAAPVSSYSSPPARRVRKKPKTLFELLFN